ncbi:MAG TPA: hypothetical protein VGS09_01240 [Actinomycetota bacterium]|nr:hypothetical protein [Actinomycetota bacterium]
MIGFLAIAIASILVASCGASGGGGRTDERPIREGDAAPAFTLPNAQGPRVSLTDFRGQRSVLLYFSMGPG